MEVLLVRHAKSAHDYSRWKTDGERPLAQNGRNRQTKASKGMVTVGLEFDVVWVSPFLRAQQTMEIIQNAYGSTYTPRIVDELKVWGDPSKVRQLLLSHAESHPESKLLLVGHNPNMSDLVELLTGEDIYMRTSDVVHIRIEDEPVFVKYYPRSELMASF